MSSLPVPPLSLLHVSISRDANVRPECIRGQRVHNIRDTGMDLPWQVFRYDTILKKCIWGRIIHPEYSAFSVICRLTYRVKYRR